MWNSIKRTIFDRNVTYEPGLICKENVKQILQICENYLSAGQLWPVNYGFCTVQTTKHGNSSQERSKLGGAAEHLIDGGEKRICRLSFEFQSPYVIEKHSKKLKFAFLELWARDTYDRR